MKVGDTVAQGSTRTGNFTRLVKIISIIGDVITTKGEGFIRETFSLATLESFSKSKGIPMYKISNDDKDIQEAVKYIQALEKEAEAKRKLETEKIKEFQTALTKLCKEFQCELDINLEGDTHGVTAEIVIFHGNTSVKLEDD